MTPGARFSAAIDCLDQIFSGVSAEKSLTSWARRSRFAGSKDRAAVRDHVFDALRSRDSYASLGGGLSGRSVMIGLARAQELSLNELFNGEGHSPARLSVSEQIVNAPCRQWDMPDFCVNLLKASHPETAYEIANALKSRAPVDLRVNLRKTTVSNAQDVLEKEAILTSLIDSVEAGLRVISNARKLRLSQAYMDGLVELQDAGSQSLVNALPLRNDRKILDYCAGGGGKTLAAAAQIEGSFFAHDVNFARMNDIPHRAKRAGVDIHCVEMGDLAKIAPFDVVLCDAPCSGSGSWRRAPDAKWKFDKEKLSGLLNLQGEILRTAQNFVHEDGYLCYATCSLFSEENEDQVNDFLANNKKFKLVSENSWTPLDECDGFYVAVLQLKG